MNSAATNSVEVYPMDESKGPKGATMTPDRMSEISEYIRDRMRREEAAEGRGYQFSFAQKAEMSPGGISQFRAGKREAGLKLINAACNAWEMGFDDLAREAKKLHLARNPALPNRDAAIAFLASEAAPEVLTAIRLLAVKKDLAKSEWIALIEAKQKEHDILKDKT